MVNWGVFKTCGSEGKWFLYECLVPMVPVPRVSPSLPLSRHPHPPHCHSLLLLTEWHWLLRLVLKLSLFELLPLLHVQEKKQYSIA